MRRRLSEFLREPEPGPGDEARQAALVGRLMQATLTSGLIVVAPIWIALSPPSERLPAVMLAGGLAAACLTVFVLARRGQARLTSWMLASALLALFSGAAVFFGGMSGPLAGGYLVVIVLAYVLLGLRGALLFAALSAAAALGVLALEVRQALPPVTSELGLRAWVLYAGMFALMAVLLHTASQPARQGLESARRLQVLEAERARELDALLQAHGALLSTLELNPLLDNILLAAIQAIPAAEKGTILLHEPGSSRMRIRAVVGYQDARIQRLDFAGEGGYSAKAMRLRQPLLVADARADASVRYDGDIEEVRAIQSAIVAPLIVRDTPLGVISLDANPRAAFAPADLRLLVGFAAAAATAIDHARLHAELQAMAGTDSLTGLANRRIFEQVLPAETARAERYGQPLSLVFFDIDSFKEFNDRHGHLAGDARLQAVAELLRLSMRQADTAVRFGGEEFALLLPNTAKDGALSLAERLREAAEASGRQAGPPAGLGHAIPGYTLSLGVAAFPEDAGSPMALLQAADDAELRAKREGKNRVCAALPLAP